MSIRTASRAAEAAPPVDPTALERARPEPSTPPPAPRVQKQKQSRPEKAKRPPLTLTRRELAIRGVVGIAAALMLGFVFDLVLLSHVQYSAAQQQLRDAFQKQLADGVAPVSEGDSDNVLLPDGAPVALLQIPSLGLESVVVEGTSSAETARGPGHRRDTVLPGQAGTSVVMGRSSAYGAPFSRIAELKPRDTFTVITGQGEQMFAVIGVRYQKDQEPQQPAAGESRLVLETAIGAMPFTPSGVVRVDARLVSETQAAGPRQTPPNMLPLSHRTMATDTGTVWALVFGLQALIALEIALIWALPRLGIRRIWAVVVPCALLVSLIVTDQIVHLLPNLL